MTIPIIQATKVQSLQEDSGGVVLIDVREEDEFAEVASPYAKNFPLSNLKMSNLLQELQIDLGDTNTPIYFICRSGARSLKAAEKFYSAGYENVFNVEGGMNRWIELGLPTRK